MIPETDVRAGVERFFKCKGLDIVRSEKNLAASIWVARRRGETLNSKVRHPNIGGCTLWSFGCIVLVMIPDLQSSILCDDVRQERNGKFILIGLFDAIGAPTFPLIYPRLFMVTRWCGGEGKFQQRTRILRTNPCSVLIEGKDIPVQLPGSEATATNVEAFINVAFKEEGTRLGSRFCWTAI